MKLHLDSYAIEGTPKELVEYQELLEGKESKEVEDKPMGYTFWYIDGVVPNHLHVLKTSIDGYFEDSKGRRYTHYAVRGLVKPIDNAYVREEFEDAKHNSKLLKYYPTVDVFAWK
ncbi:hypothetical protein WOJGOHIN_CDS0074 [Staphylococcus phage PG-2021_87]